MQITVWGKMSFRLPHAVYMLDFAVYTSSADKIL